MIAGRGTIPYRLVVIDDCSPEEELSAALDALAAKGEITLLRNDENLGFVASVNRGMSFSNRNDVVLLNSDTVVPKGWLDRLYAAAYGDECVGTVTALSNNATICSLPEIGGIVGLPYGFRLAEIDDVCRRVNRGKIVDLPTAHGFCMFIKRAAIFDVGLFDADTFGKGYGEENDFSLRAAARGWRNVAACDVFVQHLGSVSFGLNKLGLSERNLRLLQDRYPDYHRQVMDFIRSDPLASARNAIQKEFWRGRRIVVIVALSIGGGVSRHINDLAEELRKDGFLPLILGRGDSEKNTAFILSAAHDRGERLIYPVGADAIAAVMADILELGPEYIEVHHLLDLDGPVADCIRLSGIPYRVMLHDFFYLCPRVSLLDDATTFCGVPGANACDRCIARGGAHPALSAAMTALARNVSRWRDVWTEFLAAAAQVIAPSRDTAHWYGKHMPDLRIEVVPHEIMTEVKAERRTSTTDVLKVAVIGAIGPHKGLNLLLSLLRHAERWAPDIEFIVIGHTAKDAALKKFENVRVTGPYPSAEAAKHIADADCSVALFLSPWPETYSYTFSEALTAGLTPVAIGYGAFVERIEALSHGRLLKPEANPAEIIEVLRDAGKLPARQFVFTPARAPFPAVAADRAPLRLIGRPEGVYADGWLGLRAKLVLYPRVASVAVELALFVPNDMPGQYVTMTLNGERIGRHPIEAGQITRLPVTLENKRGLAALELKFDFEFHLSDVDLRRASAVLSEMRVKTGKASYAVKPDGTVTMVDAALVDAELDVDMMVEPWETALA